MKKFSYERVAVGVIYTAMALILLAKQCVILKNYSLSLWPDMTYYLSFGLRPGVVLPVLGSILTAFCKFPLLGALLLLLSLLGISAAMKKVVGDTLWAHLPSICMFLFLSGLDYSLYLLRSPGILFSQILGLASSVLILWGAEAVRKRKVTVQFLYAAAAVIIGYPLFGAFALAALAAMSIKSLIERRWGYAAFCLVSGFFIPAVYTEFVFTHIDSTYTFLSGFPYMDFLDNHRRFIPLACCIASVVILPSFAGLLARFPGKSRIFQSVFAIVVSAALFIFSYTDRNFHLELYMEQALERNDWDRVLELAARSEKPTRVIVMYRNIALMRTGRLCSRMFTFSHESVPLDCGSQFVSQSRVCAPPVFFYNGMLNFSARWAFEMSMLWQKDIERYKYLAKVALFSGYDQRSLVEKYLDIIARNPFERKWVKEYRGYLDDPSLLRKNEDYRYAMALSDYERRKFASSAIVEYSLTDHYLDQRNPGGIMLQLCLAEAMKMKEIDLFWYYLDRLLDEGGTVPVHVGEAALLFASQSGNQKMLDSVVSRLGGGQSPIVRRFAAFDADAKTVRDAEAVKEQFRSKYGRTYWYYFYFVKDITTD